MTNRLLRSLGHRNFRLYFGGQLVSLIGTWMQQVALSWLVYITTESPFWLGMVTFCGQLPTFFLAPVAGVVVDRVNRHRLIVVTQTLAMTQAFVLAFLVLSDLIVLWQILVLSAFLGIVNVFDMTGRQAFFTQMIARREDLANAIALNSSMVNGTRLVGPALAGLLLAWTSAGVCFLINGVSYLAVLAALLAMEVPPRSDEAPPKRFVHGLGEGIRYAFGFTPIRDILLLLSLVSLTGMSYTVLLPIFAREVLKGGADTLGWLTAAAGLGALTSAVALAARKTVLGLGRWIAVAPGLFGVALIAFSFSVNLWLSMTFLLVAGFALMAGLAASNTILQTIVDEDKRGRVMSFYAMAFMGVAPLGSLVAGTLADRIGAEVVVRIAGGVCIVGSIIFALRLPHVRAAIRPIYRNLGILPEVATGIDAASELTRAEKMVG